MPSSNKMYLTYSTAFKVAMNH